MAYEPLRLKEFLENVNNYLLPAIQRDYVWKEKQIYSFLDSLMRGYPVGAMLFWKKPKGDLYTFIRDYTTKKPEAATPTEQKKAEYAVLDGQQRLTSLYIAFRGSYKGKKMYFNIAGTNYNADMKYEFCFLSKGDTGSKEKKWVLVEEICCGKKPNESKMTKLGASNKDERANILKLFDVYAKTCLYFCELKNNDFSDVLQIFIRINSKGTQLSKAAYVSSSLIKSWPEAKMKLNELEKDLNNANLLGDAQRFNSDFIIRTAMYVVGNGTKIKIEDLQDASKINKIKNNWNGIRKAILLAVRSIKSWGFSRKCITSYSAIMPIALFLYHNYKGNEHILMKMKGDLAFLKKFFVLAQLNSLFDSSVDTKLAAVQACMSKSKPKPMNALIEKFPDKFDVNKDMIKSWLKKYTYHDKASSSLILSLIYPKNYSCDDFHIDHLHPKSFFMKKDGIIAKKLNSLNISQKEKNSRKERCNQLPNLGLLPAAINQEKNATELKVWLKKSDPKAQLIPKDAPLGFNDFNDFFKLRFEKMVDAIWEELKK